MANTMLPSGISVRIREDLIDGISRVQTTLVVDPIITQGGHRVTMADIGTIGYGKINGGTSKEELISWTGITDNVNTYTLTGCTWGINFHNLSSSVENRKRHTSGNKFEIKTDMHYITNQFRDNLDNTFTGTDPLIVESTQPAELHANELKLGDGNDTDKKISAVNGDANSPFMKYDTALNKWVVSNDGVNSYDPEQGGSGVTAGDAISIVGGAVNVKTKESSAVHVTGDEVAIEYQTNPGLDIVDNKLGVKVKAGTGLLKDADGIYNDSIDPDAPVAQAAGYLTGGTDVVLANFQTLGLGANNGAVKINVDGTVYDNLVIPIATTGGDDFNGTLINWTIGAGATVSGGLFRYTGTSVNNNSTTTFHTTYPANGKTKFEFNDVFLATMINGSNDYKFGLTNFYFHVLYGNTKVRVYDNGTEIDTAINVNTTNDYKIELVGDGKANFYINGTLVRTGANASVNAQAPFFYIYNIGTNLYITCDSLVITDPYTSLGQIATAAQVALRAATGSTETVTWNTDHFVITSAYAGRSSQVLKLMAPSTGTDISGAGYLDLGLNAVETQGAGDDYKIVRLDDDGKIPASSISGLTPVESILMFGRGSQTAGTSAYLAPYSSLDNVSGEYEYFVIIPFTATITGLVYSAVNFDGNSHSLTVRKNGVNTTLTSTNPNNSISVVSGDRISINSTCTGSGGTTGLTVSLILRR